MKNIPIKFVIIFTFKWQYPTKKCQNNHNSGKY